MNCKENCKNNDINCKENYCRYWIDYREDNNCSLISIDKQGSMTLAKIAERLGLTISCINQIEKKAQVKLKKRINSKLLNVVNNSIS